MLLISNLSKTNVTYTYASYEMNKNVVCLLKGRVLRLYVVSNMVTLAFIIFLGQYFVKLLT
jgi:hypothetical protein